MKRGERHDAADQRHEDDRAATSRSEAARSARTRPHRAPARTRSRRGSRRVALSALAGGTAARISTEVRATSGTLRAKIQRQETWSTIQPPASGPTIAAIPPQAVHDPIAAPRSLGANAADDDRERARCHEGSRRSLECACGDQRLDRRSKRHTRARALRTPRCRSRTHDARRRCRRATRRSG